VIRLRAGRQTIRDSIPGRSKIQGESIFWGDDRIGHCERIGSYKEASLNGYQDRAVTIYGLNSVRFLNVGLDEERSLQKKRWGHEMNC
jgi:hypothetical protein